MRKSLKIPIEVGERIVRKWKKSIQKIKFLIPIAEKNDYYELVRIALENEFGKGNEYYDKFIQIEKDEPFFEEEGKVMVHKHYYRARKKQLDLLRLLETL